MGRYLDNFKEEILDYIIDRSYEKTDSLYFDKHRSFNDYWQQIMRDANIAKECCKGKEIYAEDIYGDIGCLESLSELFEDAKRKDYYEFFEHAFKDDNWSWFDHILKRLYFWRALNKCKKNVAEEYEDFFKKLSNGEEE